MTDWSCLEVKKDSSNNYPRTAVVAHTLIIQLDFTLPRLRSGVHSPPVAHSSACYTRPVHRLSTQKNDEISLSRTKPGAFSMGRQPGWQAGDVTREQTTRRRPAPVGRYKPFSRRPPIELSILSACVAVPPCPIWLRAMAFAVAMTAKCCEPYSEPELLVRER